MDELEESQVEELRRALLVLSEELREQLSVSKDASRPVDLNEPIGRISRVDAMQQQGMVAANRQAAQRRKQLVEAALERFGEDEYGDCLACGEPIGYPRLEAQPEAPLCIDCQSQRESVR
jgi:DnaK suppressor protein